MVYTIKQVAALSGVSTRTLRYYDEIQLLVPAYINASGYRIYDTKEIDRLQQILFYRSLSLPLEAIRTLLTANDDTSQLALNNHLQQLLARQQQLDQQILTLRKTLRYQKGELSMTDSEKFYGLKKAKLQENEANYGQEIREKYGETAVASFNNRWLTFTEADVQEMKTTEADLFQALKIVCTTQEYQTNEAKTVFSLHKKWLNYFLPTYTATIHKQLGKMYVADERFANYYNKQIDAQAAHTLNTIIQHYA